MKITVFTPTYNRAYILGKLYHSLVIQAYRNFEWLIIDDGSSDHTEELVENWKEENEITIRYYKVDNGGKHRAINKATDLAKGELFFIVDSDDTLTSNALQTIVGWEESISDKEGFCGVSGNRGKEINNLIGETFDGEFVDATSLQRNDKNIKGDKAEVFYTGILRNYKFKEFEGEKFLTEATVWEKMAHDGYKIRWFNEVIYLCNYLEDGLTRNQIKIFSSNPKGTAYYIRQQIKFYNYNLKGRLANYNLYYSYVKDTLGINKAAKLLEIKSLTLLLAVGIFQTKNYIWTRIK
ncbi:glycosyltransferase [Halobacillus litoralis]|uniref:Glycosyltransferase n=1 Tax=Halobacillus litoralis TaxID=45668 RepID=A0A845F8B5_9BACI|nr:glycosyltransferase family 2 protein [Halobacillus litoralis]MYL69915.1 glycosyltransferase [Halobacillus litoralis]